jgi:hypothetical protein
MQHDNEYRPDEGGRTSTPNAQMFKEIEQFSKELCQDLATQYGDCYEQSEVVYGLAAFLTAVHQAVKNQSLKKVA